VVRAVGGALTTVRGLPTDTTVYHGVATGLRDVWLAVQDAIEGVVDHTSLAQLTVIGVMNLTTETTTNEAITLKRN
jgi:DNA-binding IscR family transcriptional regulator